MSVKYLISENTNKPHIDLTSFGNKVFSDKTSRAIFEFTPHLIDEEIIKKLNDEFSHILLEGFSIFKTKRIPVAITIVKDNNILVTCVYECIPRSWFFGLFTYTNIQITFVEYNISTIEDVNLAATLIGSQQ